MASTYTGLGTELMTTGENASTWGTKTNTNLKIIEQLAGGYIEKSIAGGADTTTLAVSDGSVDAELAHRIIKFTGTITGNQIVTIPLDVQQMYILVNGTSGAYTVQFKYASGSGSSFTFAATDKGTKIVYATADDGTNPNLVDTGIGSTGTYDLDGGELTLDADSDTSITASTDDQIDFEIAGADDFTMTANAFNVLASSHITFVDSANAKFGTSNDMLVYHDGSNSYITNAVGALKIATETSGIALTIGHTTSETTVADNLSVTGNVTVGVDDTGGDVKFFGASAGAYALWDESADLLDIRGATAAGAGLLRLTTGELTVVDGNKLGRIDFQAPLESDGTDAIAVAASIWAEADDTFSASVNNTDIVFATGKSEAAAEKFRFTADNEIGIAGANYGTDGQVLTSGGAGAAVAWEDAATGGVTAINNATQSELVTIGSTTTELDAEANLTFTGSALTCIGTITVGVDNTGHDVKYFGATSGNYWLWDESADGVVQIGTLTVGVDDAGHDVKYFGATAGAYWLWDESADGVVQIGTLTVGVDDAGHDVKLFGATSGSYALWDESEDSLLLNAATLDLNGTADGLILDANGNTTISSPTDDQIDFEIAGADDFTMTANTFTILSGSTIAIAAGGAITNAGTMAPDITSTGKALVFGF
jgi:hypothetical protein